MMNSYYDFQKDIVEKYGTKSVIMMMVGSFYEIYEYQGVGKAQEMSAILNITLTKKDKKKEMSVTNPFMCGFPSYCLFKYVDLLVKNYAYTVGIVDQSEDMSDDEEHARGMSSSKKLKQRSLSRVYSPGIPYEYDFVQDDDELVAQDNGDHVVVVFTVEKQKRNHLCKNERYFISFVMANLSFGDVMFHEEEFHQETDVYEFLNRLFVQCNVSERVWCVSYILDINRLVDVKTHTVSKVEAKYADLSYQQKILHKMYPSFSEDHVISQLNLEMHPMIVQHCTLLADFIHDHCPLVLRKVRVPVRYTSSKSVYFNIRSYYELNIINANAIDKRGGRPEMSVIDMMDKTCTGMGRRYLRHVFFTPTYDVSILQERYSRIAHYLTHADLLSSRRAVYKNLCDMERKHRLMCLGKSTPKDVRQLLESIQLLVDEGSLPEPLATMAVSFLDECSKKWCIEKMEIMHHTSSCFHLSPSSEVLEALHAIEAYQQTLDAFLSSSQGHCQTKVSTSIYDDRIQILTTRKKWSLVQHLFPDVTLGETKTSACTVHSPSLDMACDMVVKLQKAVYASTLFQFQCDVESLVDAYTSTFLDPFITHVSHEDVMMNFAFCTMKYKYIRPHLSQEGDVSSSLACTNLRHAIIEQIQEDEPFVDNDISMSNDMHAMLVYGLNSAGKSTLLKSVGIAVLLAQIGMYVPASSFRMTPFHQLFTKIYVMDNIYKGQSTFLYELEELKFILQQCNQNSLVLCDELTSGTETASATGLLASTILSCVAKKTRIVCTTHLHTLSNVKEITKNKCISIQHFAVFVEEGKIHYHRKLEPGMGESLYGIEIADAIGFPPSFIKTAFDIRNKVLGKKTTDLVNNTRSRYNRKVIMDACSQCGSTQNLHTHHIVPQSKSDKDGFIGTFHKNKKFNLDILCASCHSHHHHPSDFTHVGDEKGLLSSPYFRKT